MFHCSMAKRGSIVLILVLSPFLESIFLVYPTQFLAKYSKKWFADIFWSFHFSGNPPDVHKACQDYKIQYEHAKH